MKKNTVNLPAQAAAACTLGAGATRVLHEMAAIRGFSEIERKEIQKKLEEARSANFGKSGTRPRFKRKATIDDQLIADYDSLPAGA